MAGGTWKMQDKVRPGAYINVKSKGANLNVASVSGVTTIPLAIDFGPEGKVIEVTINSDLTMFGYDLTDKPMLLVQEALKRASKVLVYRVGTGGKATQTEGSLSVTAKYGGERGNAISLVSKEVVDDEGKFVVQTFLDSKLIDTQTVQNIEEMQENAVVTFSGTGKMTAFSIKLAGGSNTEAQANDYKAYFSAIQLFDFNTMALPVSDASIKTAATSFIVRMRNDEGKKCQLVLANHTVDDEAVINVKNGVVLSDGTMLSAEQATAWVAGASAAAGVNQSLTYSAYDGAIDVSQRYLNSEIEKALLNGEFVFTEKRGQAIVEQDINSLHSFSVDKDKSFSKNRVLRVLDDIANNTKKAFEDYFIGKVDNNLDGRELFKSNRINYFNQLQGLGAIQNFAAEDVTVEQGLEKDSIVMNCAIQPVDAMEKLYMTVQVQ